MQGPSRAASPPVGQFIASDAQGEHIEGYAADPAAAAAALAAAADEAARQQQAQQQQAPQQPPELQQLFDIYQGLPQQYRGVFLSMARLNLGEPAQHPSQHAASSTPVLLPVLQQQPVPMQLDEQQQHTSAAPEKNIPPPEKYDGSTYWQRYSHSQLQP